MPNTYINFVLALISLIFIGGCSKLPPASPHEISRNSQVSSHSSSYENEVSLLEQKIDQENLRLTKLAQKLESDWQTYHEETLSKEHQVQQQLAKMELLLEQLISDVRHLKSESNEVQSALSQHQLKLKILEKNNDTPIAKQ